MHREWPATLLWRTPRAFAFAGLLGPAYSLRCVLFHHISDVGSPFTDGLPIRITPSQFERCIRFLVRHYTPVGLEVVLAAARGHELPPRPVLITFDDAYASVATVAAPICIKHKVPATFFVNAGFLDNRDLALDNLVCFVANRFGFDRVRAAVAPFMKHLQCAPRVISHISKEILPFLSTHQRIAFHESLFEQVGRSPAELAEEAAVYATSEHLRELSSTGFEIGNHTYSHVHCRTLTGDDYEREIIANQRELECRTGRRVRAFSVPYGSSLDLTPGLTATLRRSGHEAVFLSESRPNTRATAPYRLSRVSVHARTEAEMFAEIEVLPRMRAIRDCFRPLSRGDADE